MFDFLRRSIIMRVIKQIDANGFKKWPVGWIKVRRAAAGWKFVVGYLVYVTPDILQWTSEVLPGLLPAVGLDEYSAPIVRGIGSVLMAVGAVHKFLKFLQPVERRSNVRKAAVIERVGVTEEVQKEFKHRVKEGTIPPGVVTEVDVHREITRRLQAKQVKKDGLPQP